MPDVLYLARTPCVLFVLCLTGGDGRVFRPPVLFREETNYRGFVKGRFSTVLGACALVPVFGLQDSGISKIMDFFCQVALQGNTFWRKFWVQGNICQNHPSGNHPFANPCFRDFFFQTRGGVAKARGPKLAILMTWDRI